MISFNREGRRSFRRPRSPPWASDRSVAIAFEPTVDARFRTVTGSRFRTRSSRSSARSAPFERADRASRSTPRALSARMTAATFAMSSLRNRLLDPHADVTTAVLRPKEDFVVLLQSAHRHGASPGRHESNRLRVLDDRRVSTTLGFRLHEEEGAPFHLEPTDDGG